MKAVGDALREAQPSKELGFCDAKLHGSSLALARNGRLLFVPIGDW